MALMVVYIDSTHEFILITLLFQEKSLCKSVNILNKTVGAPPGKQRLTKTQKEQPDGQSPTKVGRAPMHISLICMQSSTKEALPAVTAIAKFHKALSVLFFFGCKGQMRVFIRICSYVCREVKAKKVRFPFYYGILPGLLFIVSKPIP